MTASDDDRDEASLATRFSMRTMRHAHLRTPTSLPTYARDKPAHRQLLRSAGEMVRSLNTACYTERLAITLQLETMPPCCHPPLIINSPPHTQTHGIRLVHEQLHREPLLALRRAGVHPIHHQGHLPIAPHTVI